MKEKNEYEKVTTFTKAQSYIMRYIPLNNKKKFPGDFGLKRQKYFLSLLGNPQNKLKIIHIAGTSGKGSTAYITSSLLAGHGFKVGLHISPHIVDMRERIQINNLMISKENFVKHLNDLIPFIEKMKLSSYGSVTYFEILVALSYYVFLKEHVDYAVVETGLGGLYDGTNAIDTSSKFVILTKLGFDHTEILGNTIEEIAYQKAMIIQPFNRAFSIEQNRKAADVIKKVAEEKKSFLTFIKKGKNYSNIKLKPTKIIFDYKDDTLTLAQVTLSLTGGYQAENASLALAAFSELSKRDKFTLDEKKVRKSLQSVSVPARFQIFHIRNKYVVVDGAHNEQKMNAFISNLKKIFPQKKFDFLVAFKKGKDINAIVKSIIKVADGIIISRFFTDRQDMLHLSEESSSVVNHLQSNNFNKYKVAENKNEAFELLLRSKKKVIVITGSFYFASEILNSFPDMFKPVKEQT